MASGTQGYEAAQGDIIQKIIDRFKNRKKDDGGSQDSAPDQPGSQPGSPTSPTPTSSMLIQGATVNQLMSGSSGLSRSPINITEYGEDKILQAILIEQQKTNEILTAQNEILTAPTGISKFDKQEQDIEAIDDLSGTQGYEKARSSWWRKLLSFLGLKFAKVLASLKTLVPAIVAAASKITSAILLTGAVSTITNIFSKSLNKFFTKKFLPKVKPPKITGDVPKITNIKGDIPTSVSTSKLEELYNAKKLENLTKNANNLNVKPNSTILNEVGGPGKVTATISKVDETVDAGNSIKSTNKM